MMKTISYLGLLLTLIIITFNALEVTISKSFDNLIYEENKNSQIKGNSNISNNANSQTYFD